MAENETQSMENRLIHGDVLEMAVEKEMQVAYLDYAMSVIVSRALPDVRDGLKPVHRRILYAMHENNITHNRAHKKSARIVGEVMGKYHPHGDSSIYMALVRMAQDFSMGTMLIDGQGNFGSIDNDPPAAMRYTEARLQKISQYLLDDLDKDTVDFKDNYDGLEKEPSVLPAGFPNILANGSEGIAVGMATSIPPYNLGEIIDACLLIVEKPGASDAEFLEILHAPDFPTGCIIVNKAETAKAVLTGRGSVIVRGKAHFEEGKKTCVVITEMPYQVVKSGLIEKIAELVKDKRIEGISNIRDESNKKGIRVVVELKKDVSPEVILNYLYKLTQLQSSFSINSLVLNANKPELMGAKAIIKTFIAFREEVIVRRLTYQLGKTRDRAHLVLGLHVAIDSIDKIIAIIRGSSDANDAKSKLLNEVWHASESVQRLIDLVGDKNNKIVNNTFKFTEEQVKSIIEMRLSRLTGLERDKLVAELEDLGASISDYLKKLGSRTEIMKIISDELIAIKNAHAIPRRTTVDNIDVNTNIEDFIERENVLVIITNNGYIKRSSIDAYRSQKRGGKGKSGINTNEDDDVAQIIASHTHSGMLFFSEKGQVYRLKTHQIPVGTNIAKGRAIVNLLPIEAGEKMATIISMPENPQEWDDYDIIFATKKGKIRRSAIKDFSNINAGGKIAIRLDEDDALIGVSLIKSSEDVLLATKNGLATRFDVQDLRVIKSRTSDGVRGINLNKDDEVVSMCILNHIECNVETRDSYLGIPLARRKELAITEQENMQKEISKLRNLKSVTEDLSDELLESLTKNEQFILTITETGFGKRTSAYEYRTSNRGGKGVINVDITRGKVISTFVANGGEDIMLVTNNGQILRCSVDNISVIGRNTKGVTIFNLKKGEKIVSVTKIDISGMEEENEAIDLPQDKKIVENEILI